MKVDRILMGGPGAAPGRAAAAEGRGFSGALSVEIDHDPFIPLALAATATERIELGTSIAVAFARSPMTIAQTAYDIQELSGGRLKVGVGSQIKPHITKRFSMEWSSPAARMAEYIEAMKAIWASWMTGDRLDFRGEFYTHTLMTPMFNPGPLDCGPPDVWVAGVGPKMTEAAGAAADGFICHGFTTKAYVEEVTLPALTAARAARGLGMDGFEIVGPGFIVTGENEEAMEASASAARAQLAFYGSTPAYKPVLDLHGWGDLQPELNRMSKEGKWVEMGALIDDEMLSTFAVVAEPSDLAAKVAERWGGIVDRMTFNPPEDGAPEVWDPVIAALTEI